MSDKKHRRFFPSKRFWIPLAVLIVLGLLLQRPILSNLLDFGVEVACGRRGLEFSAESVRAGLFEPLVLEGVSIRVHERTGDSRSAIDIERLQVDWQKPVAFFSNPRRLVAGVTIEGMNAHLDFRRDETGVVAEGAWSPVMVLAGLLNPAGEWPESIVVRESRIDADTGSTRWVADGLLAEFLARGPGRFEIGSLTIHSPRFKRVLGPLSANTDRDGNGMSISGMEILPGVVADRISCRFEPGRDPALSFQGRLFGGTLRGDWNFQRGERGPVWDFATVCSNVALEAVPTVLGIEGKSQGRLAEGRFTYRGEPGRPADAEASLRVLAKDFRWNDRGWESLEIGASLIHRRLLVSNFDLRQSGNTVTLNGEISLAEGWGKITDAPFLVNLRANIQELGSLAKLTGVADDETKGVLVAEGSVSGRPGSLDGFVGLRAKQVEYRGIPVQNVDLEVLFKKSAAEIVRCEMKADGDSLRAKGMIGLSAPHAYRAELDAAVSDVAKWLRPFPAIGGGVVSGGSLKLKWSGDGSLEGHSGAFDLGLAKFLSEFTPAGLTGKFAGTYSPKNIYFSNAEAQNGPMRMRSRVTLSASGINLDDLELRSNGKDLLRGKVFLPVNPFSLRTVEDWNSAVLDSRDIYLEADTPGELELGDLAKLAGQEWPIEGRLAVELEAFGPAKAIDGKLTLRARELVWRGRGDGIPSELEMQIRTANGTAKLEGELANPAMSPLKLSMSFPFGLDKDDAGVPRWVRRNAEIQASADFPRADLALLRPFFSNLEGLSGELSGKLDFQGTLDAPRLNGSAEIRNASFRFGSLASPAQFVNGQLEIQDGVLKIRDVSGEIDPGRLEFSGECAFPEPWKPRWTFQWLGERLPVRRDGRITLLADCNLRGAGNADSGKLEGRVDLVESKIASRLQVVPFLSAPGAAGVDLQKSTRTFQALVPGPDWALDVLVETTEPIAVTGGKFPGTMEVDLRFTGTAANPLPVGSIAWLGIETGIPAGAVLESGGMLAFFPDKPAEPFVMGEAAGVVNGDPVSAVAFGPLSEGKWCLRGGTPQAQFLLLREGLGIWSAADAAMGPVEFFLLKGKDGEPGRAIALRIEDHSFEGGGVRFVESLDFSLRGSILPAATFKSGHQWMWSPAF